MAGKSVATLTFLVFLAILVVVITVIIFNNYVNTQPQQGQQKNITLSPLDRSYEESCIRNNYTLANPENKLREYCYKISNGKQIVMIYNDANDTWSQSR